MSDQPDADRLDNERSDTIYEVETGYHRTEDEGGQERVFGPGERFRPTVRQEQSGSLAGKARPVDRVETSKHTGADIGLRALEWDDPEGLDLALAQGVDADDFEAAVEPSGDDGFTVGDVEDYLEPDSEEGSEGETSESESSGDESGEGEPDEKEDSEPEPTPIPDDFPHAEILRDAGLETLEDVAAVEDLTDINGIASARAKEVKAALGGS